MVGATGGVGTALVPLLAAAGVRVVATATAADAALLSGLGAAAAVGYTDAYPRDVDVAFNLAVPGDRLDTIARGRSAPAAGCSRSPTPCRSATATTSIWSSCSTSTASSVACARSPSWAAGGVLPATISRRYTLDEAPVACVDFLREHITGKLVVTT